MPKTEFTDSVIRNRISSIDTLRGFAMFWIIGGAATYKKVNADTGRFHIFGGTLHNNYDNA